MGLCYSTRHFIFDDNGGLRHIGRAYRRLYFPSHFQRRSPAACQRSSHGSLLFLSPSRSFQSPFWCRGCPPRKEEAPSSRKEEGRGVGERARGTVEGRFDFGAYSALAGLSGSQGDTA